MSEHTPGPWTVAPKNGRVIMAGESKIATAFKDSVDPPVSWVNAQLIAAAPELLAACEAFIAANNQCGASLAFVMAQQAVRKATGET